MDDLHSPPARLGEVPTPPLPRWRPEPPPSRFLEGEVEEVGRQGRVLRLEGPQRRRSRKLGFSHRAVPVRLPHVLAPLALPLVLHRRALFPVPGAPFYQYRRQCGVVSTNLCLGPRPRPRLHLPLDPEVVRPRDDPPPPLDRGAERGVYELVLWQRPFGFGYLTFFHGLRGPRVAREHSWDVELHRQHGPTRGLHVEVRCPRPVRPGTADEANHAEAAQAQGEDKAPNTPKGCRSPMVLQSPRDPTGRHDAAAWLARKPTPNRLQSRRL